MHQSPKLLCLLLMLCLLPSSFGAYHYPPKIGSLFDISLANETDQLARVASMVGGLTNDQRDWLQNHPATLARLDEIANQHFPSDLVQANQIFDHFNRHPSIIISTLLFSHEIAYLKQLHPDWHLVKIVFTATWNVLTGQIHSMLDLVGLVPGLGEGADFVNGVFYILEGDKANATYSFLAMVPFVGWVSTGAKYAGKIVKTAAQGTTELKFIVNSQGVIGFGSRQQLTRVIGSKTGHQAHHLVPWALNKHKIVQKAADSGNWHPNMAKNGQHLDLSVHNGFITKKEHGTYNDIVEAELDAIFNRLKGNLSPQKAIQELETMANDIRIQLSKGKKLDEIIL